MHPEKHELRQDLGEWLLERYGGRVYELTAAIMRLHRYNTQLVALRDAGREAIVWEEFAPGRLDPGLVRYDVGLEAGAVELGEIVAMCDRLGIEQWVQENRGNLCWVNEFYR